MPDGSLANFSNVQDSIQINSLLFPSGPNGARIDSVNGQNMDAKTLKLSSRKALNRRCYLMSNSLSRRIDHRNQDIWITSCLVSGLNPSRPALLDLLLD